MDAFARTIQGGDGMSEELKPCPFCGGKAERKETERYMGGGGVG